MNFFLSIWITVSALLIGFMVWTLVILVRQKITWKAFAKKHKIRYKEDGFTVPPQMEGVIDGYGYNFFSSEHSSRDRRTTRYLTAIEVLLSSKLPFDLIVASGLMVDIFKEIGLPVEIKPDDEKWNDSHLVVTSDESPARAYLTPKRLDVLMKLMAIKNTSVLLIAKNNNFLLRIDISDPLITLEKLEKLKNMFKASIKILELDEGEARDLKNAEVLAKSKSTSIKVKDDELEQAASGLSLEDDAQDTDTDDKDTSDKEA